jgi:hypothetical protein
LSEAKVLKGWAAGLRVSAVALKWRLVALEILTRKEALAIDDRSLRSDDKGKVPPLFSRLFREVLADAIDQGRLSARRTADLVNLTLEDLAELFEEHGVKAPYEL